PTTARRPPPVTPPQITKDTEMTTITTAATTTATPPERHALSLDIVGMTCASCANRIEKRLNRIDGVIATVNYATEKAKVTVDGDTDRDELVAAVRAAGYDVVEPA